MVSASLACIVRSSYLLNLHTDGDPVARVFPSLETRKRLRASFLFSVYIRYIVGARLSLKMTFICLWTPAAVPPPLAIGTTTAQPENGLLQQLVPSLLGVAPRVMLGANGIVWADARGMSAESLARDLLDVFQEKGVKKVRAAISIAPVLSLIHISEPTRLGMISY